MFCYSNLAVYYGNKSNDSSINKTDELLDIESDTYESDHCICGMSKIQVYYIFLVRDNSDQFILLIIYDRFYFSCVLDLLHFSI